MRATCWSGWVQMTDPRQISYVRQRNPRFLRALFQMICMIDTEFLVFFLTLEYLVQLTDPLEGRLRHGQVGLRQFHPLGIPMSLLTSMPPAPVHPRVDSTGDQDQDACNALLGRRGGRLEAPACRF